MYTLPITSETRGLFRYKNPNTQDITFYACENASLIRDGYCNIYDFSVYQLNKNEVVYLMDIIITQENGVNVIQWCHILTTTKKLWIPYRLAGVNAANLNGGFLSCFKPIRK